MTVLHRKCPLLLLTEFCSLEQDSPYCRGGSAMLSNYGYSPVYTNKRNIVVNQYITPSWLLPPQNIMLIIDGESNLEIVL